MIKIEFMCIWDKCKERTWSGINFSLFTALAEKSEIYDAGFRLSYLEKRIMKLFGISLVANRVTFQNSLNFVATIIPYLHAEKSSRRGESVQIQIGDITKSKNKYYIYQDLSVDSLIYMKKNKPIAFQYSNYQYVTKSSFKIRSIWQRNIYRNASGIFTMSKWLADNLITYSGVNASKVHHVGGGINICHHKSVPQERMNNKILFIGRDFKRKAGSLVCDAFKILRNRYLNDAELYIIGPAENPLHEVIEGVNFIGDINSDELSVYFNKCDIFCMPSHFEAYGLVFIEALVYGLPCIGRNEFAMKEFIQDGLNGYLIDNNDSEDLAYKMFNLLQNQSIKEYVAAKKEEYILNYSWKSVAERILKIIEQDGQASDFYQSP